MVRGALPNPFTVASLQTTTETRPQMHQDQQQTRLLHTSIAAPITNPNTPAIPNCNSNNTTNNNNCNTIGNNCKFSSQQEVEEHEMITDKIQQTKIDPSAPNFPAKTPLPANQQQVQNQSIISPAQTVQQNGDNIDEPCDTS